MLDAVGEGLRYTMATAASGRSCSLQAVLAVCARPFFELLPGFAADVFGRGAPGLAMLSSTVGIGAGRGRLLARAARRSGRLTRIVLVSSLLIALVDARLRAQQLVPGGGACVALAGFAMVVAGVGTQTLMQSAVEEDMRGRVLSLFGLIFRGGPALGALVMGAASEAVGLQAPLAVGALLGIGACGLLWRRRQAIDRSLEEPAAGINA